MSDKENSLRWQQFKSEATSQGDWTAFADACDAIVRAAAGDPDVVHRLYPVLLRHVQAGPSVSPTLRGDMREIWEARCG